MLMRMARLKQWVAQRTPEHLLKGDRNISRESGIATEQVAQSRPRDIEVLRQCGHTQVCRLDNLALQPVTDMNDKRRLHLKCEGNAQYLNRSARLAHPV